MVGCIIWFRNTSLLWGRWGTWGTVRVSSPESRGFSLWKEPLLSLIGDNDPVPLGLLYGVFVGRDSAEFYKGLLNRCPPAGPLGILKLLRERQSSNFRTFSDK